MSHRIVDFVGCAIVGLIIGFNYLLYSLPDTTRKILMAAGVMACVVWISLKVFLFAKRDKKKEDYEHVPAIIPILCSAACLFIGFFAV